MISKQDYQIAVSEYKEKTEWQPPIRIESENKTKLNKE